MSYSPFVLRGLMVETHDLWRLFARYRQIGQRDQPACQKYSVEHVAITLSGFCVAIKIVLVVHAISSASEIIAVGGLLCRQTIARPRSVLITNSSYACRQPERASYSLSSIPGIRLPKSLLLFHAVENLESLRRAPPLRAGSTMSRW